MKPAFDQYIRPTIAKADVIVPRGGDNTVAINLISQSIKHQLEQRGVTFRSELLDLKTTPTSLPANVQVLRSTNQLKIMHTIIRDATTSRDDFIFYSQRLFRLLLEEALSALPFEKKVVITPTHEKYEGRALNEQVCGVSIIRAGGALEAAFQNLQKNVRIGKLLIQTDVKSGEPQVSGTICLFICLFLCLVVVVWLILFVSVGSSFLFSFLRFFVLLFSLSELPKQSAYDLAEESWFTLEIASDKSRIKRHIKIKVIPTTTLPPPPTSFLLFEQSFLILLWHFISFSPLPLEAWDVAGN